MPTIDLAHPPADWPIRLAVGCDPRNHDFGCARPACATAGDIYQSGFQGVLQMGYDSLARIDARICLHFTALAGLVDPTIRVLALCAPHAAMTRP